MNKKLLFITLLCINAHNYGAQQNGSGQNAQPRFTLHEFLDRQRNVLDSLHNIPALPTNPMLADAINRSEDAAKGVRLSSFMLPTFAFVIPAALLSGESKLPFVVAAGFLGGISGALLETARRRAADRESTRLQQLTPYSSLKRHIADFCNFENLSTITFPYFLNENPNGFNQMTYNFTYLYASHENPYPILTARNEMLRLIEIVRKLRGTLSNITSTPEQTNQLRVINQNLEALFINPLLNNLLNLDISSIRLREVRDKKTQEYHDAVLEKLKRR